MTSESSKIFRRKKSDEMSKITFFSTFFILTFLASELCGNPLLVDDETEEFGRIVNGRNAEEGNTTISEKNKKDSARPYDLFKGLPIRNYR